MTQFDTGEKDTRDDVREEQRAQRNTGRNSQRDDRDDRDGRDDNSGRSDKQETLSRFFGTGRTSFGGISNKLLAQFTEVFESTADAYDNPNVDPSLERRNFKIQPLDNSSTSTVPTLLVCLPTKVGGKEVVINYSLVLEPSGPQRMKYIRGERNSDDLTLPIFVEDHLDNRWRELIAKTATRMGSLPNSEALSAGFQIIPNDLMDEKSETVSRELISSIFSNAIDAICATREDLLVASGAKVEVLRLSPEFVDDNNRFSLAIDYSRTPRKDTGGSPIRADIAITVFHEEVQRRGRHDRYDDSPLSVPNEIGTIAMAVDLEHIDNPSGAFGGYGNRSQDDEPYFQPVLNITDIVGAPGVPWALESTLLMIGSATLMSDNYRWVESLRGRNGKFQSLESLDALLLANPDPQMRDIAEGINSNSTDQELSEYLNKTVAPDLFFGMVLNPAGEKAWAQQIFELIALADGREAEDYEKVLYAACDRLTGNLFTETMEDNDHVGRSPVRSVDSRLFLGHFLDADNNVRDIREWNQTAVLNFKRKQPREAYECMLDYQDTMLPSNSVEMNQDLATRYGMLTDILGASAFHIRGTAECIQLESWFMRTLAEALNRSGMMPHINDNTGLRTRHRRSTGFHGERVRDIGRQGRNRRDRDEDRPRRR